MLRISLELLRNSRLMGDASQSVLIGQMQANQY